jgi:hypothetical protein
VTAAESDVDDTAAAASEAIRDTIPPARRQDAVEADCHRCQACGARGPGADGTASLQVHHIEDNPEHCDYHDLENLTTLCEGCHDWVHKQPSEDDVPVELSEADKMHLRPHDYEILQYLYDDGPAMVSRITDALTFEVSEVAVRERLWLLMGLDQMVQGRERQLIDHDAETGEWGFPGQITHSERGRIPGDIQLLIQRIEDEWVRQALDRGCDRNVIAEVFDLHERTTWHKERRAYAYEFPLKELSNGDDSARVVEMSPQSTVATESDDTSQNQTGSDTGQQQLGAASTDVADESGESPVTGNDATANTDREGQSSKPAESTDGEGGDTAFQGDEDLVAAVQHAITALTDLQERLP